MKNNKIPTIVMMSTNIFVDKLEDIRGICRKHKAKEILDNVANDNLFYFSDNESWVQAREEIQLLVVGRINFKLSSKRVIIIDEMKDTIVNPPQPPSWFLEFENRMLKFQEEMLKFQAMVIARFDKQEEFNNYVISRFDKLDSRLDNIVKLNNLKE